MSPNDTLCQQLGGEMYADVQRVRRELRHAAESRHPLPRQRARDGPVSGTFNETGLGQCQEVGSALTKIKTAKADSLDYVATIATGPSPRDTYVDCGTSDLFFTQNTTADLTTAFGEDFLSDLARPAPVRGHGHGRGRCG